MIQSHPNLLIYLVYKGYLLSFSIYGPSPGCFVLGGSILNLCILASVGLIWLQHHLWFYPLACFFGTDIVHSSFMEVGHPGPAVTDPQDQ